MSQRLPGYPHVSLVPFVLDHAASPLFLVSRLAEHTRNMAADERTSLAAHAAGDDVQAAERLTLLGTCRRASVANAARYLRYFPDARALLELDFDFYRLEPTAIRYIAGFGAVHWIAVEDFRAPSDALAAIEDEVLAHMNADHPSALVDYCRNAYGRSPAHAAMIGVDCDGFDLRADGAWLRFDFPEPVHDAQSLRAALVSLARASRA